MNGKSELCDRSHDSARLTNDERERERYARFQRWRKNSELRNKCSSLLPDVPKKQHDQGSSSSTASGPRSIKAEIDATMGAYRQRATQGRYTTPSRSVSTQQKNSYPQSNTVRLNSQQPRQLPSHEERSKDPGLSSKKRPLSSEVWESSEARWNPPPKRFYFSYYFNYLFFCFLLFLF